LLCWHKLEYVLILSLRMVEPCKKCNNNEKWWWPKLKQVKAAVSAGGILTKLWWVYVSKYCSYLMFGFKVLKTIGLRAKVHSFTTARNRTAQHFLAALSTRNIVSVDICGLLQFQRSSRSSKTNVRVVIALRGSLPSSRRVNSEGEATEWVTHCPGRIQTNSLLRTPAMVWRSVTMAEHSINLGERVQWAFLPRQCADSGRS